jgi:hypothetical protein
VPEVTLMQSTSKSSSLCDKALQLMGRVFPADLASWYTATIMASGDHSSNRTVALTLEEQVREC